MKYLVATLFLSLFLLNCNKNAKKNINLRTENEVQKPVVSKDSLKKYAEDTKKSLIGNLTQKIAENGTENALEFCNVNAISLTQKLNDEKNINVKRVTDKPRNPNNLANDAELKIIQQWKDNLANKQEPKAVFENGTFYAPVVTNAMCMQCHGNPQKDIKPNVLAKIQKLYPNDKATGYSENQIRGILVVAPK